jgi:hypothetical protein
MFAMLLALAIGYTLHAKDVFQPPKPPDPRRRYSTSCRFRAIRTPFTRTML